MEKLSVIIATINDAIATNLTIAQILQQLEMDKLDYEIILVDNGSDEREKGNLHNFIDFHKDFPIYYYEYNIKGTVPPHSYGVTKATGKYITMPDPHLVFSPHYFKIMIDSLKAFKEKDVEVIFSPFSIGCVTKRYSPYISASHLTKPNPFGKCNSIGENANYGDELRPILSNTLAGFVCERKWFLKIGNMFPEAFEVAGGHTAESLMIGIPTWMFGKKCYAEPSAVVEHPVYRTHYGEGRNANMYLSMAVGAYICGGRKYLDDMPKQYGEYVPGQFADIIARARSAREYIEKNAKITLDELVNNWETIRYS